MYTMTVTYRDFDNNERVETHYFNLTTTEILEWEMSSSLPLTEILTEMIAKQDRNEIMKAMIDIVRRSYGRKTEDGRSFRKSDEIWEDFYRSGAWDACFKTLLADSNRILEFVVGILPAELQEKMNDSSEMTALRAGSYPPSKAEVPKKPQDMTREELLAAMQAKMAGSQV